MTLAAVLARAKSLRRDHRVTEVHSGRVFLVHEPKRVLAVVYSADGTDATCTCGADVACEHVAAVYLTVREERSG